MDMTSHHYRALGPHGFHRVHYTEWLSLIHIFGSELREQRASTDQRIVELKQSLQTVAIEKFGGEFNTALKAVLEPLDQLENLRKAIGALAIEPKKAIDYYSNLNADFLNLIAHIVKGTSNSEIAIAATAYLAFLQSKEKAGIERAVLNNTFARHGFAAGMFNQFSGIVAVQDAYLGPVSYTHLDVYKRQASTGPASWRDQARLTGATAVSYTHLDPRRPGQGREIEQEVRPFAAGLGQRVAKD